MQKVAEPQNQRSLIASAQSVLLCYSALEVANQIEYQITANNRSQTATLNQFIAQQLKSSESFDAPITINNQNFHLEIKPQLSGTRYSVKLTRLPKNVQQIAVKSFLQYSSEEQLDLVCIQRLCFTCKENGKSAVGAYLGAQNFLVGSVDKISLYRSHLVTLHQMITHLERGGDVQGMLIALATGSGKTFIQALWMLVIVLSGQRGIFSLPNKLINQYKKDLEQLLPYEVTQVLKTIYRKSAQVAEDAQSIKTAQLVVASFEELLDQHYVTLKQLPPGSVQLSFDEQHLVMNREARKQKLIKLSQQFQCVLLTATPAEETYRFCGGRPVAINSSKQKQREGHGRFPRLIQTRAKNLEDKGSETNYNYGIADRACLAIVNSITGLRSSAAMTVLQELEYFDPDQCRAEVYTVPEQHRTSSQEATKRMRWNYQPPISRKILLQVDDNEELINIHNYLTYDRNNSYMSFREGAPDLEIYQDGNAVSRRPVYDFFRLESNYVDRSLSQHYQTQQQQSFETKFARTSEKLQVDSATMAKVKGELAHTMFAQLDRNIVASFYEYIIRDLTGLTTHELNQWRLHRPDELLALFQANLTRHASFKTAQYYQAKLTFHKETNKGGVDPTNAVLLGRILAGILNHTAHKRLERDYLSRVVDNWTLDPFLYLAATKSSTVGHEVEAFCQQHRVIYLMAGMNDADTAIDDSRPFSGFDVQEVSLFNGDGSPNKDAKRRVQLIYETLNSTAKEKHFRPQYLWSGQKDVPKEQAEAACQLNELYVDNLFRLGFIGMYISNKKSEGFSDVNLHTVINVIPKMESPNNNPATLVQSIGRLRGLDPTQNPYFIQATGKDAEPVFDLRNLETQEDFYPVYFESMRRYQQELAIFLGGRVAKEILRWIYANQNPSLKVDPEAFNHAVTHFVTRASLELHNANDHDHARMRKLTARLAQVAMQKLDAEKQQITQPYQSTIKVMLIGNLLYAAAWIGQWFVPWSEGTYSDEPQVKLYWKIINTTSYLTINQQLPVLGMFKTIRDRLTQEIPFLGKQQAMQKVSPVMDRLITTQLLPALAKWFKDPMQRREILTRGQAFSGWIRYAETLAQLDSMEHAADQGKLVREVFSCVPGTNLEQIECHKDNKFLKDEAGKLEQAVTLKLTELVKTRMEIFIATELPGLLRPFLTESDHACLSAVLALPENAKKLLAALTDKTSDLSTISPKKFFATVKSCFAEAPGIKEFMPLDLRLEAAFKAIQENIQKTYMGYRWREKWLPLIVKLYAPNVQAQILQGANTYPGWATLLASYMAKLEFRTALANAHDPQSLLPWFNRMLNEAKVEPKLLQPRPENYQDTVTAAMKQVMDAFAKLADPKAYANLSGAAALGGALFSAVRQGTLSAEVIQREAAKRKLAEYLRGDFLNHIEPLFTLAHFAQLRAGFTGKDAEAISLVFAGQLIEKFASGQSAPDMTAVMTLLQGCDKTFADIAPVPMLIQTEMQHFATMQNLAATAGDDKQLTTAMQSASQSLSVTESEEFNVVMRAEIMPSLLSIFKPEKRAQIKTVTVLYPNWLTLFLSNFSLLLNKSENAGENAPASPFLPLLMVLQKIPGLETLTPDDLVDLPTLAKETQTRIEAKFKELPQFSGNENDLIALWQQFLQSELFKSACSVLMIDIHAEALAQWLSHPDHVARMAARVADRMANSSTSDMSQIIALVKECSDGALNVELLDQTFATVEKEAKAMKDTKLTQEEIDRVLKPIFFAHLANPEFRAMILSVTELFDLDDYRCLVAHLKTPTNQGKNAPDAETQARELYVFAKLFKAGDLTAIYRRFVKVDQRDLHLGAFERIIYRLADIYDEVLRCHRHHHGIYLGQGSETPEILGGHRVSTQQLHSLLGYTLYLKSVMGGFAPANSASEHTNKPTVRQIEQAQTKVLATVADEVNSWWITRACRAVGRFIWRGCVAIYFGAIHLYKWIARQFTGEHRHITDLKPSAPNPDSAAMRESAVEITTKLRDAEPIPDADLTKPGVRGHVDTVKKACKHRHHKKKGPGHWSPAPVVAPPSTQSALGSAASPQPEPATISQSLGPAPLMTPPV